MIIKLTLADVKGFVSTSLNLNPARFDIEIVSPAETPILAAFKAAIREFPFHASYEKIQAIKKFRDLVPKGADGCISVGLADAKWAVENPLSALENLARTGRILG